MRALGFACLAVALGTAAIHGCSSDDSGRDDAAFIKSVRANGFAQSYNDDLLKSIHEQLCGNPDLGESYKVKVINSYSALTETEKREMVDISNGTCGGK